MTKSLDHPDFLWLPSEDDLLSFPTENQNIEEKKDFLAGLTHSLAQSSLNDIHKRAVPASFTHHQQEYRNVANSPQSTLSGLGSLPASSNASPDGTSRVPSPQTSPFGCKNNTWDRIYAAAGEVARLNMYKQGRAMLEAHQRHQDSALYSNNSVQFQQESCAPLAWGGTCKVGWQAHAQPGHHCQMMQNRGRAVGFESARCGGYPVSVTPSAAAAPAWPRSSMHQPRLSGRNCGKMAVFLGGSEIQKKSTGTGVFLPSRPGIPVETQKKSGCVMLVPPKVVQALNMSFDEMNGHAQPRFISCSGYSQFHVDGMVAKSNGLLTQQIRLRHEGPLYYEMRLPQDWTY